MITQINGPTSFMLLVVVRSSSTFFLLDKLFIQQGVWASFITHRSKKSNHFYTINHDLSIIWVTPHFFLWLIEYRAGKRGEKMRNQSWQSSTSTLFSLANIHLRRFCQFSGEGEQALWLWGWKDICFHTQGMTYTNKNLSHTLAGLPLTLNTHTVSWPIQFHQFGKEWLMMNCLLSPYFISISLWILKRVSVRNNTGVLEMTCQFPRESDCNFLPFSTVLSD